MDIISIIIGAFMSAQITAFSVPIPVHAAQGVGAKTAQTVVEVASTESEEIELSEEKAPTVPFYSQFGDISSPYWQKRGCGIASLAMLVDYYGAEDVSVDALLDEGRAAGAYISGAGWSHWGLVNLSRAYGLDGEPRSLAHLSDAAALLELKEVLAEGPVIASVHYTFKPSNPIPHLAVINGISGDTVYYNDPANPGPGSTISSAGFLDAWKKRFIVMRPQA